MSSNPYGLLGEDDSDDITQLLIAAQQLKASDPAQVKKAPAPAAAAAQAKLPSKPLPPAQSVREARTEVGLGGGRGRGRGGRGGGFNRDINYGENTFRGNAGGYRSFENRDGEKITERRGGYGGPRGSFRGGRSGGFNNGESGDVERPRRVYERHSGTGRGSEIKREGGGHKNWGTAADEIALAVEEVVAEKEKTVEKPEPEVEQDGDATKEKPVEEPKETEPEDKEMTLEEYEKVLEEKRKALLVLKPEERKVDADLEFKSMQQLSDKKSNDEIFVKLGSDKEKRKETTEKEEKVKRVININDFLKPTERERPGGRGRGRGRGTRGVFNGRSGNSVAAFANIEDHGQFPALGVK